ncbi:MAG: YihY/virulence factor BrkB family protein [Treponema sp.]|nr:YihY/virulence factor BrkB family protein [Treponema sp.]
MKTKQNNTQQQSHSLTLVTLLQSLYFSIVFTSANDLISYAAACAFGFMFSFIPIVMMILVILIRFLHAKPEAVTALLNFNSMISNFINLDTLVQSIHQIKKITNFEIILSITIIWMSRRFFISFVKSMKRIFKKNYRVQKGMTFVLIVAGEASVTILMSILLFIFATFRTIIKLPILKSLVMHYPSLMDSFTNMIVTTFPLILMFIAVLLCYKFGSRTNPTLIQCIFPALGCIFTFWGFKKIMKLFININRYNYVYGVLSNVVVLLLEVYFFFFIFLFFAQYLFVNQFFEILILSELYTLPSREDISPKGIFKRLIFIRPDYLLHIQDKVIRIKKGEYIYRLGENSTDSYYLSKGTVRLSRPNTLSYISNGMFFGEAACMLEEIRNEDAIAETDVELVKIPEELFFSILEHNPTVSRKVLSQISSYFSKFYGRNDEYPL